MPFVIDLTAPGGGTRFAVSEDERRAILVCCEQQSILAEDLEDCDGDLIFDPELCDVDREDMDRIRLLLQRMRAG